MGVRGRGRMKCGNTGLGWSLQTGPERGGFGGLRGEDWEARPGREERQKDSTKG